MLACARNANIRLARLSYDKLLIKVESFKGLDGPCCFSGLYDLLWQRGKHGSVSSVKKRDTEFVSSPVLLSTFRPWSINQPWRKQIGTGLSLRRVPLGRIPCPIIPMHKLQKQKRTEGNENIICECGMWKWMWNQKGTIKERYEEEFVKDVFLLQVSFVGDENRRKVKV